MQRKLNLEKYDNDGILNEGIGKVIPLNENDVPYYCHILKIDKPVGSITFDMPMYQVIAYWNNASNLYLGFNANGFVDSSRYDFAIGSNTLTTLPPFTFNSLSWFTSALSNSFGALALHIYSNNKDFYGFTPNRIAV